MGVQSLKALRHAGLSLSDQPATGEIKRLNPLLSGGFSTYQKVQKTDLKLKKSSQSLGKVNTDDVFNPRGFRDYF